MKLTHTRQQCPIGQGFFHTGTVHVGDAVSPFHYVYDCGSDNRNPLQREITDYVESLGEDRLDCLFLSHFDSDHVCGLDRLLLLVHTKTAIAPYLSPTARLILIAKALADGQIDSNHLAFLCDPTSWLLDRGVEEVIYITPPGPPDETPGFTTPPGPNDLPSVAPPEDGRKMTPLLLQTDGLEESEGTRPNRKAVAEKTKFLSCSQPIRFQPQQWGCPNWQFVMFVHPEGNREETFRTQVRRTFGRSLVSEKRFELNQSTLISILRQSDERAKLAACYEIIRKNPNLTSLSMYSGPIDDSYEITMRYPFDLPDLRRIAWLGTGDSNLKTTARRNAFRLHFQSLQHRILTMSLPHHGARANFHPDLLSMSLLFVSAAGEYNKHGHPSEEVVAQIKSRLYRTTENVATRLYERFDLEFETYPLGES